MSGARPPLPPSPPTTTPKLQLDFLDLEFFLVKVWGGGGGGCLVPDPPPPPLNSTQLFWTYKSDFLCLKYVTTYCCCPWVATRYSFRFPLYHKMNCFVTWGTLTFSNCCCGGFGISGVNATNKSTVHQHYSEKRTNAAGNPNFCVQLYKENAERLFGALSVCNCFSLTKHKWTMNSSVLFHVSFGDGHKLIKVRTNLPNLAAWFCLIWYKCKRCNHELTIRCCRRRPGHRFDPFCVFEKISFEKYSNIGFSQTFRFDFVGKSVTYLMSLYYYIQHLMTWIKRSNFFLVQMKKHLRA